MDKFPLCASEVGFWNRPSINVRVGRLVRAGEPLGGGGRGGLCDGGVPEEGVLPGQALPG